MGRQPESKLSRAIIAAIRANGGYAVKFHGGPMTEAGTPDILACIPVRLGYMDDLTGFEETTRGLFVGIETKMPTGGDPTPIQRRRHNQIDHAWGHVIVPRSVSEALEGLDALGWVRQPPLGPSDVSTAT
jgi:hypothetical protein